MMSSCVYIASATLEWWMRRLTCGMPPSRRVATSGGASPWQLNTSATTKLQSDGQRKNGIQSEESFLVRTTTADLSAGTSVYSRRRWPAVVLYLCSLAQFESMLFDVDGPFPSEPVHPTLS
jgi:hypothetical protein